jgi:hypothetical protein
VCVWHLAEERLQGRVGDSHRRGDVEIDTEATQLLVAGLGQLGESLGARGAHGDESVVRRERRVNLRHSRGESTPVDISNRISSRVISHRSFEVRGVHLV